MWTKKIEEKTNNNLWKQREKNKSRLHYQRKNRQRNNSKYTVHTQNKHESLLLWNRTLLMLIGSLSIYVVQLKILYYLNKNKTKPKKKQINKIKIKSKAE